MQSPCTGKERMSYPGMERKRGEKDAASAMAKRMGRRHVTEYLTWWGRMGWGCSKSPGTGGE